MGVDSIVTCDDTPPETDGFVGTNDGNVIINVNADVANTTGDAINVKVTNDDGSLVVNESSFNVTGDVKGYYLQIDNTAGDGLIDVKEINGTITGGDRGGIQLQTNGGNATVVVGSNGVVNTLDGVDPPHDLSHGIRADLGGTGEFRLTIPRRRCRRDGRSRTG